VQVRTALMVPILPEHPIMNSSYSTIQNHSLSATHSDTPILAVWHHSPPMTWQWRDVRPQGSLRHDTATALGTHKKHTTPATTWFEKNKTKSEDQRTHTIVEVLMETRKHATAAGVTPERHKTNTATHKGCYKPLCVPAKGGQGIWR
jgi:hypothetical protein